MFQLSDPAVNASFGAQPPSGAAPDLYDATQEHSTTLLEEAKRCLAQAGSRVPTVPECIRYLDHLRAYKPWKLDQLLGALRRDDRDAWHKLQASSNLTPLNGRALGHHAAGGQLGTSVSTHTASTGSMEQWLQTHAAESMRSDRWGTLTDRRHLGGARRIHRAASRAGAASAMARPLQFRLDPPHQPARFEFTIDGARRSLQQRLNSLCHHHTEFAPDGPALREARSLLAENRLGELDAFLKAFE